MFFKKILNKLFRNKEYGYIRPLPNILLCRALRSHQKQDFFFYNHAVWTRVSMFATISLTIRRFPSYFSDLPNISFQNSEKRDPKPGYFTIFCEKGWLPREAYQISSLGVNQHHHVMGLLNQDAEKIVTGLSEEEYERRIAKLREDFIDLKAPDDLCSRPFFLFALQIPTDLNFKRSGLEIASIAKDPDAAPRIRRHFSEQIAALNPDARVLFLQHPFGKQSDPDIELMPDHVYVRNTRKLRALDLATSPNCRGVITINSNTINEALLFGLPVFQLGDFIIKAFPNQFFPYTFEEFLADPGKCRSISQPRHYIGTILENQATLEDLKHPAKLRRIIDQELARKAP